jgi:serine/threonine-protein kinase RsbW
MKNEENTISLEFVSDLMFTEFSVLVLGYIKNFLKIDEETHFQLEIALREVINNAIVHGNKSDISRNVHVTFKWKKPYLKISIKDQNSEMVDFDQINRRLESNDLLSTNGRGITIMKSYMDKVKFIATEDGSEVIMEKRV